MLPCHPVQVTQVHKITPRTVRITLGGNHLRDYVSPAPDAQVKLFFPLPGQAAPAIAPPVTGDVVTWYRSYLAMPDDHRPPMRTYTVRSHRAGSAEIDIDFVLHPGAGPAGNWAAAARPGDTIALLGSTGSYVVPAYTRWQLLAGDETAVPAIAAIIESAPRGTVIRAYLEVATPAERQHFPTKAEVTIDWLFGRDSLLPTLRTATFEDGVYAWLAGEAGLVKSLRRHLIHDRAIPKQSITFTGYWRRGMSEEAVGRDGLRKIEAGKNPNDEDF